MSYIHPLDVEFTERYETHHPLPVWFYLRKSNDHLVLKFKEEHRVSFYGTILGHEIHVAADIAGAIKYNGGGPTRQNWCVNPMTNFDVDFAFHTLLTYQNLFGSINSPYQNCGAIAISIYQLNAYDFGNQPISVRGNLDAFVAFVQACLIGQGKDVSSGYVLWEWEALELQDAWNGLQDWLDTFDVALQANRALRVTQGSKYDIKKVMPVLKPFEVHRNRNAVYPDVWKYAGSLRFAP